MTTNALGPMNLGGLFDRLFKLIATTWVQSLIVASVILVPLGIIFAAAADLSFTELADTLLEHGEHLEDPDVLTFLGFFMWFFFALVLFLIGTIVVGASITILGCSAMTGEAMGWKEALRLGSGMRFLKILLMYLIEVFLFGALLGIPYALVIAAIFAESATLGLVAALLILVGLVGTVYLAVSFAFTVPVIAWEDADIFESFRRSWHLVRFNWWRTFGILILMSLLVSFAVSLVMTPVYIVALWDFFRSYFEMFSMLGSGEEPDASFAMEMIKSLGFGIGIINGISTILQMLVAPLYTVVMYFDLRARKGEFPQATPAAV